MFELVDARSALTLPIDGYLQVSELLLMETNLITIIIFKEVVMLMPMEHQQAQT